MGGGGSSKSTEATTCSSEFCSNKSLKLSQKHIKANIKTEKYAFQKLINFKLRWGLAYTTLYFLVDSSF